MVIARSTRRCHKQNSASRPLTLKAPKYKFNHIRRRIPTRGLKVNFLYGGRLPAPLDCAACFGFVRSRICQVSCAPTGATVLRCTTCCRCLSAKMYRLPVSRRPGAKTYDLLPVSRAPTGASGRRRTICCRWLGLQVVLQREDDVRLVAAVLGVEWCPSAKMYDVRFAALEALRGQDVRLVAGAAATGGAQVLRCTV